MRKKTRTSAGFSLLSESACLFFPLILILVAAVGFANPACKEAQSRYALIAGTVFRDNGLSLPGAEVTIAAAGNSAQARKFKQIRVIADARGEFAVRVPPVAAEYWVTVKASGYLEQKKTITVTQDERIDIFFQLEPAPK